MRFFITSLKAILRMIKEHKFLGIVVIFICLSIILICLILLTNNPIVNYIKDIIFPSPIPTTTPKTMTPTKTPTKTPATKTPTKTPATITPTITPATITPATITPATITPTITPTKTITITPTKTPKTTTPTNLPKTTISNKVYDKEVEPNNNIIDSTRIETETIVSGKLISMSDIDNYVFSLNTTKNLTLELFIKAAPNHSKISIHKIDKYGNILGTILGNETVWGNKDEDIEKKIELGNLQDGIYNLKIIPYRHFTRNSTYKIQLKQQ